MIPTRNVSKKCVCILRDMEVADTLWLYYLQRPRCSTEVGLRQITSGVHENKNSSLTSMSLEPVTNGGLLRPLLRLVR